MLLPFNEVFSAAVYLLDEHKGFFRKRKTVFIKESSDTCVLIVLAVFCLLRHLAAGGCFQERVFPGVMSFRSLCILFPWWCDLHPSLQSSFFFFFKFFCFSDGKKTYTQLLNYELLGISPAKVRKKGSSDHLVLLLATIVGDLTTFAEVWALFFFFFIFPPFSPIEATDFVCWTISWKSPCLWGKKRPDSRTCPLNMIGKRSSLQYY